MIKDHKIKETVKRLSITKEERERFVELVNAVRVSQNQLEGIKTLLMFHSNGVRQRLEIKDEAPKGYKRIIDFDPETYDFLVIDRPEVKELTETPSEPKKPIN